MPVNAIERPDADQVATLNRLRADLARCVVSADRLGLMAIAIYLQRASDELRDLNR